MSHEIAIIIPAYKSRFLARALDSLAKQTNRTARIYVFDDASAEPIGDIARVALSSYGNWEYHRFDSNLGARALTKHYDRCIRATREPWIWLFSDDDLADPGCVSAFTDILATTSGDSNVYCFDSLAIDANDAVTELHPSLPDRESWKEFAYFYFTRHRMVPQQAMMFSRAAYEQIGGFVDFPVGWTSDQATLMALAGNKGIRRIPKARIRFRLSGVNISSIQNDALAAQKWRASIQFVRWILERIETMPDPSFALPDDLLRVAAFAWFRRHLAALHKWYDYAECRDTAHFLSQEAGEPYFKALGRMAKINLSLASQALWMKVPRRFVRK